MHGTLLGWYWNRKVMPWDSDLDVMVSEKSLHFLASYCVSNFSPWWSKVNHVLLLLHQTSWPGCASLRLSIVPLVTEIMQSLCSWAVCWNSEDPQILQNERFIVPPVVVPFSWNVWTDSRPRTILKFYSSQSGTLIDKWRVVYLLLVPAIGHHHRPAVQSLEHVGREESMLAKGTYHPSFTTSTHTLICTRRI